MNKKVGLFALSMGLLIPFTVKAQTTLPAVVDGKIILTENVDLNEKYVVNNTDTITIDLAGYTLTGPSDNYAIDSSGTLNIIDSSEIKGKINCPAASASCIRNNKGTLVIDGVGIQSSFVAVKTEPDSQTTIKNTTIVSTYSGSGTGAVLNWGTTNIIDSKISAPNTSAIYANCGEDVDDNNILKDSTTNISNSELVGKYIYFRRSIANNVYSNATITDSKINLTASVQASNSEDKVKIMGKTEVSAKAFSSVMSRMVSGELIPLGDVSLNKTTLNPGVTLTINDGITAKLTSYYFKNEGTLNIKGTISGLNIYNEVEKEYYANIKDAYSYSDTNATVKLINDAPTSSANIKSNRTIDLNGYTLSGTLTVGNSTTEITIEDNSTTKTGKVTDLITNNGILNIKGGTYLVAPVTQEGATTNLIEGTYPINNIENVVIPEDKKFILNENGTYSIVYKDADYTALNEIVEKAKKIIRENYTVESIANLDQALNKVNYDKKIYEQSEVDQMVLDIKNAIANLKIPEVISKDEEETTKDNEEIIKNPETSDKIYNYILGLVSSLGTLTLVKKKNEI